MEIKFKDICSLEIEDVFPNPTDEQLRKWNEIGEEQKTSKSHYEGWNRTYHSEIVKMVREDFEELYGILND